MTIVVWAFSTMGVAVWRREENALVSLLLLVLLGATMTNDLLFSMEYIYTMSMLPFGLIVFVFVQAVFLSRKFYHAYRLSENLSATLTATNRDLTQLKESLEHKVEERTEVLQEKNRELAVAINTRRKISLDSGARSRALSSALAPHFRSSEYRHHEYRKADDSGSGAYRA